MGFSARFREAETVLPQQEIGRHSLRESDALEREWLVTNGIGGYGSATIAGALTRRYHGLLIAALKPPLRRTLLLAKLDETIHYLGKSYPLFTDIWHKPSNGAQGHFLIERFYLLGSIPCWEYRLADALLSKRIWMSHGANTTYITYNLLEGSAPIKLEIKSIVNYRSHHDTFQRPKTQFTVDVVAGAVVVQPEGGQSFRVVHNKGQSRLMDIWYRDYFYPIEARRGLEALDDHMCAAETNIILHPGQEAVIIATAEQMDPLPAEESLERLLQHEIRLLDRGRQLWQIPFQHPERSNQSERLKQLVIAADQFIVSRPIPGQPEGKTVIAGYPWFSDWGRDTMISLPGLALATGRPELAREIIRTFVHFVDRGMLPNRFPSADEEPEYNTVDATLWFIYTVYSYLVMTDDMELLEEIYPHLKAMVDWHISGTRYQIKVDQQDYLLTAGVAGVQLTWMDAKVGDWVVTPRIGKPVEINALWYNAMQFMQYFASRLNRPDPLFAEYAEQIAISFQKFWMPDREYLFDVIEGPGGNDSSLRPNQLFAVSLPHSPLTPEQQQSIVRICARKLFTSVGLRSLSFDDPGYIGSYGGNQKQRDAAYHQGTVWGWLIGPFTLAWRQAYGDRQAALNKLLPVLQQLDDHCVGSLSEIFEGDPPHSARGCISQAWSVAEFLWSWYQLHHSPPGNA